MKLRVVCDASAKSSKGRSLNDILLPGPSLYSHLTTVLQQFRLYDIAFSADISRMFREVALHSEDRDLHRYVVRNSQNELEDWRMTRVTFGVTLSPFLATAFLRQVAKDHFEDNFIATLVPTKFYVDYFLHGTNSIEEAQAVRKDIKALLAKAQMKLRKWRTNSPELRAIIPSELLETEPLYVSSSSISSFPKTLGVHWDTD